MILAALLVQASLLQQARAAYERNQLDSAYIIIQRAADAEPDNAEVQYWLGQYAGARAQQVNSLRALGIARKSKYGYSRAVTLEPTNVEYLKGLIGYLSQAPGIAGGDRDSAFRVAVALRRIDDTQGLNAMVNVLWRGNAKSKQRADSVMEDWARSHGDRTGQLNLAAWYANTDRAERALAIHERLIARDSNDVVARFGIGRNLVVLKRDPARALAHFRFIAARPRPNALQVQPGFQNAQRSLDSLRPREVRRWILANRRAAAATTRGPATASPRSGSARSNSSRSPHNESAAPASRTPGRAARTCRAPPSRAGTR